MDYHHHYHHEKFFNNHHKLSRFTKPQSLKKLITQLLLLSISVFSLVFSTSFFNLNCLCISTFPQRLVTHAVDKNCIFLLCNGILVFLAKNSGLFIVKKPPSSSSRDNNNHHHHKESLSFMEADNKKQEDATMKGENVLRDDDDIALPPNDHISMASQDSVIVEGFPEEGEDVPPMNSSETANMVAPPLDKEYGSSVEVEEKKQNEIIENVISFEEEEEEEEEEVEDQEQERAIQQHGNNYTMSTEELNKKFDEFIQRMKEEIRIEAQQQQLVMV